MSPTITTVNWKASLKTIVSWLEKRYKTKLVLNSVGINEVENQIKQLVTVAIVNNHSDIAHIAGTTTYWIVKLQPIQEVHVATSKGTLIVANELAAVLLGTAICNELLPAPISLPSAFLHKWASSLRYGIHSPVTCELIFEAFISCNKSAAMANVDQQDVSN